jgi:RNA polymerase sigma-70 factor (ECF subfamily)
MLLNDTESPFSSFPARRTNSEERCASFLASDPDTALVLQCCAGNKEAFNGLVLRHKDRLYLLALRLLKDHHEAEDVAQDAFLRAYERIDEFRGAAKFSTWLYRICYNLCLNRLEKRKKDTGSESALNALPSEAEASGSCEQWLMKEQQRKEQHSLIHWALSCLKPEFRQVLLCYSTDDLSYEEIAELLALPVGTVRSRLHRGREELKRLLRPYREGKRLPSRSFFPYPYRAASPLPL